MMRKGSGINFITEEKSWKKAKNSIHRKQNARDSLAWFFFWGGGGGGGGREKYAEK